MKLLIPNITDQSVHLYCSLPVAMTEATRMLHKKTSHEALTIPSPRKARKLNVPHSPTDGLLSPCSDKLSMKSSKKFFAQEPANSDEAKKTPAKESPLSLSTPTRRSGRGGVPMSPTDEVLSPISLRLSARGRTAHKFLTLEAAVRPRPFPSKLKLILGSSSVGRKAVMDALEWPYTRMSPDIDEKAIRHSDPKKMPVKIAKAKADALFRRLRGSDHEGPCLLVTADQIVLYNGEVREKPESLEQATEYLSSYSRDCVSTLSAVVVTHFPSGVQAADVDVATVHWNTISNAVIGRMIKKGDVMNSAGGFIVEDPDLSRCVSHLEGSMDSVVGLPVALLERLLEEVLDKVRDI